jgi:hypothetical protein
VRPGVVLDTTVLILVLVSVSTIARDVLDANATILRGDGRMGAVVTVVVVAAGAGTAVAALFDTGKVAGSIIGTCLNAAIGELGGNKCGCNCEGVNEPLTRGLAVLRAGGFGVGGEELPLPLLLLIYNGDDGATKIERGDGDTERRREDDDVEVVDDDDGAIAVDDENDTWLCNDKGDGIAIVLAYASCFLSGQWPNSHSHQRSNDHCDYSGTSNKQRNPRELVGKGVVTAK